MAWRPMNSSHPKIFRPAKPAPGHGIHISGQRPGKHYLKNFVSHPKAMAANVDRDEVPRNGEEVWPGRANSGNVWRNPGQTSARVGDSTASRNPTTFHSAAGHRPALRARDEICLGRSGYGFAWYRKSFAPPRYQRLLFHMPPHSPLHSTEFTRESSVCLIAFWQKPRQRPPRWA